MMIRQSTCLLSNRRKGTERQSSSVLTDSTIPSSTFVIAGTPTTSASSCSLAFLCFLKSRRISSPIKSQIASGIVFWPSRGTFDISNSSPLKSVSKKDRKCADICTPRIQPRSDLKRIMSGGRPPLDSPSPRGLIRLAASRSLTTLVTVGALMPDARTRSALEHEPASRRSFKIVSAFVRRSSDGLPTAMGSFFTVTRSRSVRSMVFLHKV